MIVYGNFETSKELYQVGDELAWVSGGEYFEF